MAQGAPYEKEVSP